MNLYKFYWSIGRMGEVEGLFAATEADIKKNLGRQVYFGEILGKHSDIYGPLEQEDITLLAIPEDVVDLLVKEIGDTTISGYNPLNYIDQDEEIEEDGFGD